MDSPNSEAKDNDQEQRVREYGEIQNIFRYINKEIGKLGFEDERSAVEINNEVIKNEIKNRTCQKRIVQEFFLDRRFFPGTYKVQAAENRNRDEGRLFVIDGDIGAEQGEGKIKPIVPL